MKIKYNDRKNNFRKKNLFTGSNFYTIDTNQIQKDNESNRISLPQVEGAAIKKETFNIQKNEEDMSLLQKQLRGKSIQQIQDQIIKREARTRLIQNYYRKNLKVAFDDKIRTYKLQTYMQRKDQQQKLLAEVQSRSNQILAQKIKKANQIKLRKVLGRQIINFKLQQKIEKVKQSMALKRKEAQEIIKLNTSRNQQNIKKLHNSIYSEHMEQREKKELINRLAELKKTELHALKIKQQIEYILQQQDKLSMLKQELKYLNMNSPKMET